MYWEVRIFSKLRYALIERKTRKSGQTKNAENAHKTTQLTNANRKPRKKRLKSTSCVFGTIAVQPPFSHLNNTKAETSVRFLRKKLFRPCELDDVNRHCLC